MFGFRESLSGGWRFTQRQRGGARRGRVGGLRLCHLRPCQRCVIECMEGVEPAQARHLATLGVMPRAQVTVEELAPFNGPVLLRVGDARYAVGRDVAEQIIVRAEETATTGA